MRLADGVGRGGDTRAALRPALWFTLVGRPGRDGPRRHSARGQRSAGCVLCRLSMVLGGSPCSERGDEGESRPRDVARARP
mgnify:CR=1 FL=1